MVLPVRVLTKIWLKRVSMNNDDRQKREWGILTESGADEEKRKKKGKRRDGQEFFFSTGGGLVPQVDRALVDAQLGEGTVVLFPLVTDNSG